MNQDSAKNKFLIDKYVVYNILYAQEDNKLNMINIEFYTLENGNCPIAEFILSLDPKMKAKVLRTIDLLKNNRLLLRKPY